MTRFRADTILFVDDDRTLLLGAKSALQSIGYTVHTATDGEQALAVYEAHRREIDIVVSDVVMPNMDGRELYEAIRSNNQTVRFVFSTGHGVLAAEILGGLDSDVPLLSKPWTLGQLTRAVAEAMNTATAGCPPQAAVGSVEIC
jgi:two-component system cell cycle sensor histidine kinase/response regulator CckA